MFMRLIILEPDFHSRWIKIAGIVLIVVRFSVWPFELTYVKLQIQLMKQPVVLGATCWAEWGNGVIVWNFVSDILANLFLSGMFVRRLYLHIRQSETVMTRQNRVIEKIARKSLICFILTFIVNLAMSLLKVTTFVGTRSDAFTVYFALIESTLLVEALRVDYMRLPSQQFCEQCGFPVWLTSNDKKKKNNEEYLEMSLKMPDSFAAVPCDGEDQAQAGNCNSSADIAPASRPHGTSLSNH
ncbi:hypothetical protein BX666DRAFT_1847192 [Dichotomocladium elegans]|nr:hypothetical protein BX666DRAFT_1847192 [Dichotomocladium elegans]